MQASVSKSVVEFLEHTPTDVIQQIVVRARREFLEETRGTSGTLYGELAIFSRAR